jgi:hypothetical protein
MTTFLKHLVLFSVDTIENQKNSGPKRLKPRHANVMKPYFLSIEEIENPVRRSREAKAVQSFAQGVIQMILERCLVKDTTYVYAKIWPFGLTRVKCANDWYCIWLIKTKYTIYVKATNVGWIQG